jgi:hypothetical protein
VQVHVEVDVIVAQLIACARTAEEVGGLALPAHARPVRVSAGSFDYRYECAQPVEVAATGAWQVVPVAAAAVGVAIQYTTVPSVEPRVYRTVRLENRSPHALL